MRSGKGGAIEAYQTAIELSQWSLTFEVRKSDDVKATLAATKGSQWSLTFEVRKSHCRIDGIVERW